MSEDEVEVIDAANLGAGWRRRASLPQPRRNTNSVLTPDGAVITIGGNLEDNYISPQKEALRYDPAANTWTPMAAQAEERGYHSTALLLPDGRIVSAGDDGPSDLGGQSDEIEVFSPPYLFKGARPADHLGARRRGLWARRSPSARPTTTSRRPSWWRRARPPTPTTCTSGWCRWP